MVEMIYTTHFITTKSLIVISQYADSAWYKNEMNKWLDNKLTQS